MQSGPEAIFSFGSVHSVRSNMGLLHFSSTSWQRNCLPVGKAKESDTKKSSFNLPTTNGMSRVLGKVLLAGLTCRRKDGVYQLPRLDI